MSTDIDYDREFMGMDNINMRHRKYCVNVGRIQWTELWTMNKYNNPLFVISNNE
jgi:hypothetical protein